MKNKILLISLSAILLIAFALSMVSADKTVSWPAYYRIIEANGNLNNTNVQISGFNVIGYVCTSFNCTTVDATNPVASLTNSTSGNSVNVVFPNVSMSTYGYVLYFYKPGYIGWEQRNVVINGTNNSIITAPNIYFARKRMGSAAISNLTVVNQAQIFMPIEINVTAGIDADTYAAIFNNSKVTNLPLQEPGVNTTVTLEIRDSSNNLVNTITRYIQIPYSGKQQVSFNYNFTTAGIYTINVSTLVPDARILTSQTAAATAQTSVIPIGLTNYTYTLIQGPNLNPVNPLINDTINFSLTYLSNYVSPLGAITPVGTLLFFNVVKDGTPLENFSANLPAGSNTSYSSYSFMRNYNQTGNYVLTVLGAPNSALGNYSINATRTLSFTVGIYNNTIINSTIPPSNGGNNNNPKVTGKDDDKQNFGDVYPLNSGINETTVLSVPAKHHFTWKFWLWVLIIAIILLLIGIGVTYYLKF